MSVENIESHAFYQATLNSEWYRIVGLLGLLGALIIYTLVRGVTIGKVSLLAVQTLVLAVVVVHELLLLRAVKRALDQGRDVPPALWALNVFIESQLPTVALFILIASRWMTPYQVLVAPALLLYFLFIILSILRLSPTLTVLTGLMSALGYLFVTFYVQATYQTPEVKVGEFPLPIYFAYAGLILIGGIVAAVVAGRVGSYVAAALREAALENELKALNHDLDIARSIQQGLLPAKAPGLDQFEIAGWNQPADQTGGDYFDWQALPDGRVAISLGDATGHGIGPALVSTACRAYARASLLANGQQDGLLDRMNGLLVQDLSANRFVTFAVAFLDPVKSSVKVLSAGHGPILLYRYATNEIEDLEAQGIPLGMLEGIPYSSGTEVHMAPGDMLVMITDGFYEWANPDGEEFGLTRLKEVIRDSRNDRSEAVIARLRSVVTTFARGTKQQDDLTAVILKMAPNGRNN
jgi:serine phosphatase RsbU (regulator of sigma subunit)